MSRSEDFHREHSIHIPAEDMEMYRRIAEHSQMQASVEHSAAVSPVHLGDIHALKAHLISGHLMSESHFWRDGTNEDHPHMDPIDWDAADARGGMPAMSHRDLLALHNDDHAAYPDEPHTTVGHDHFHHEGP